MPSEPDPLTQVYEALFDLPWRRTTLCTLVRPGNRASFVGSSREPLKPTVGAADLPELRLVPRQATPHVQRTSSSTWWTIRFEYGIATGEQQLHLALFPIEWELLRAMADWATALQSLTWKTHPFVVVCHPLAVNEGMNDQDYNRGVTGWVAIWSCEVEMQFRTADLLADA